METNTNTHSPLAKLEELFNTYLHKKAPFHLPVNVKEFIIKFGPYISLVLALIALPIVLAVFGIGATINSAFWMGGGVGISWYISVALTSIALIMHILAFSPLQKRQLSGWRLMYNAALVDAMGQAVNMNIVSLILGLIISMYFLFQVREYYK